MAKEFTPEQMEKLLRYAGKRLNTSPEQLREAFEKGGLFGLAQQAKESSALSAEAAEQAQVLIQDKEQAAALLNDPAVQNLLQQLLGDA